MSQLSDIKKRAATVLDLLERTYDFGEKYIPGMVGALTELSLLVEDIKKLPEKVES